MTEPNEVIRKNIMDIATNLWATMWFIPGQSILEMATTEARARIMVEGDSWPSYLLQNLVMGLHITSQKELFNGVYCR